MIEKAIKLENIGHIEQALNTYDEVIYAYSERPEAETALYNSALIWQNRHHDTARALLLYLRLEHDYPATKYLYNLRKNAAWIVKYSKADYYQAIGYYQRLYDMSDANIPEKESYLYEIADCYFHLENYTQARIELESLLLKHPQSKLRPIVLARVGELSLLEGKSSQAKEYWQQVITEFSGTSYEIEAELNLARLEEENQNLEKALDAYQSLKTSPYHDIVEKKIQHLKKRITDKNKVIE